VRETTDGTQIRETVTEHDTHGLQRLEERRDSPDDDWRGVGAEELADATLVAGTVGGSDE